MVEGVGLIQAVVMSTEDGQGVLVAVGSLNMTPEAGRYEAKGVPGKPFADRSEQAMQVQAALAEFARLIQLAHQG